MYKHHIKAVPFSIYFFTIAILFLFNNQVSVAQQTDRQVILRQVDKLRMPNGPDCVTMTAIASPDAQVIATVKAPASSVSQASIVSSRLGKGKVIVIGSELYLKKPTLSDYRVQTLITNILEWGKVFGKKTIQLWGVNTELTDFLRTNDYQTITDAANVNKQASTIVLSQDIIDSVKINKIENFVKNGGTLVFTSPLSGVQQQNFLGYYDLKLNKLFLKAGLYNTAMPVSFAENRGQLNIGDLPPYMNIHTALNYLKSNNLTPQKEEGDAYAEVFHNYLLNNSDTMRTSREINSLFGAGPDNRQAIIPSKAHPLSKSDVKNYLTYRVQQALIKQYTNNHPLAKIINPTSKDFPGEVAINAPRVNERIIIPVQVGTQGLAEPDPVYYRWHSTGLYVAAGDIVKVTINPQDIRQHLKAQIGVHDDNFNNVSELTRTGYDLTTTFELNRTVTPITSPLGGLLIIKIPDTSSLKNINIQVNGAVKAPYFKLGTTSVQDWQSTVRNYPGPWAELITDNIILTVPSYRIRNLDNPEKLLKLWNEVMDADARLAAISPQRIHPERIIVDRQIAEAGAYMFTMPYKIVVPDDESCALSLDADSLRIKGSWGHFHELGHRHQFWPFDFGGLGEVTCNLYTMYVFDKVLHKGLYNHPNIASKQAVVQNVKKYLNDSPSFQKFQSDPFLALKMYIEIIENLGWESIEEVFKTYRKLPNAQYPKTEPQKIDYWFTCLSNASHKNMTAFFDKWQIPVSQATKQSVSQYPTWLPPELQ